MLKIIFALENSSFSPEILVLELFSFVLDIAAFRQAFTAFLVVCFFVNSFVALHVCYSTNSCRNFSNHVELHASTNCQGSVSQAFRSAVTLRVDLEEL
jgi:hypothetical protein